MTGKTIFGKEASLFSFRNLSNRPTKNGGNGGSNIDRLPNSDGDRNSDDDRNPRNHNLVALLRKYKHERSEAFFSVDDCDKPELIRAHSLRKELCQQDHDLFDREGLGEQECVGCLDALGHSNPDWMQRSHQNQKRLYRLEKDTIEL